MSVPSPDVTILKRTIVTLIFMLPPVMTIGQSITSTVLYFIYFVPFLLSLSFYVSGVFAYSFARKHDSSWGNRGGDQDAPSCGWCQ